MMTNAKIATAVVGGYLLGRTKKGKLALSLGMLLAGRRMGLNPQDLLKAVADSPVLGGLSDQVRKNLLEGTKSAAGSALEARLNGLADSLHERNIALEGGDGEEGDGNQDADEREPEGEADQDDEEDREPEREAPPARAVKKKTHGTARKATGTARKSASSGGARTAKKTAKTAKTARSRQARPAKAAPGGGDE